MSHVEFPEGTKPAWPDVDLLRYSQLVYRPLVDDWDPPMDHEPAKDGLFVATAPRTLGESNGEVELVEGTLADVDLEPDLVAGFAGELAVEEISKDRQLAHHAYDAIRQAGQEQFLATPDGELFVYDEGVWRGFPDGEQRLRELAGQALGQFSSQNVLRELKGKIRERHAVDRSRLGRPPGTVATPDGLLDLEAREVQPLRPSDFALARITTTPATDDDYADSRWREFIQEAVPDLYERAKLQEYAGYTLLPGQPFKRALFLVGPTDSGKGTFLKAIEAVLGPENVAHQSLDKLVNSRWGTDKIYGRMANVSNEVSPKAISRIERFKELTGGEDVVTAERKGQPTYEFAATQKFMFATNQFPPVPHADDAFWNRCIFVKFPNTVDDPDEGLRDELRDERGVVLAWMLEGLDALLYAGQFSGERDLDERRALTKSFGSPIEQFVYEALEVTGDPGDVIHQGDLYDALARFCHFKEFDETPVKQTFTKQLTRRPGVSKGRSRRVRDPDDDRPHVYQGLRPVEEIFYRIQADVPSHALAEDDDSTGGQASLD